MWVWRQDAKSDMSSEVVMAELVELKLQVWWAAAVVSESGEIEWQILLCKMGFTTS